MFTSLLLFSSFVFGILGCAPGSGTLGSKATFEYTMVPPVVYTWNTAIIADQQDNEDDAKMFATSDVKNAINQVLQANSIPTNDVNPPDVTFVPPNVPLAEQSNCVGITLNGTVLIYERRAQTQCILGTNPVSKPFRVQLKVHITAVQSIYESQWETLASQVADKLTAKRNVLFYGDPDVAVL